MCEFNKGGRGSEPYRSGNLVNKGPVASKCRNEGGENRWEEQVLFSFSLCGQPLASSLFMRFFLSVKLSSRSLPSVVGASGI